MTYSSEDTIVAISTAVSPSGIGIIRISGPQALQAADLVFRSPGGKTKLSAVPTHTIHYGYIVQADGDVIDEVLVSVMRAPRTYTAEDTVEINCHGGVLAMRKVLDAVLACDGSTPEKVSESVVNCTPKEASENVINCTREEASENVSRRETVKSAAGCVSGGDIQVLRIKAAQPGEFTKRAFLNGRIDLSRAEAVMDLIEAKNDYALKNSVSQVRGSLYEKITSLRSSIIYQIAHIEASLDDPEHLDFSEHTDELKEDLAGWSGQIRHLIDTADDGRMAAEGIRTVIVGKPNAGKSSLLNLLVGEERAIVTEIAGTTRDTLTETIQVQGITLLITDTAGIRDTSDAVEQIGVERAKQSASSADLLLWIVDSSTALDENDRRICALLKDRPAIILLNKSDLETVTDAGAIRALLSSCGIRNSSGEEENEEVPVIQFSAAMKQGLEDMVTVLKDMFFHGKLSWNDEVVITNARHRTLLEKALGSLNRVQDSMDAGMSEDFFSIDLMDAYEALGEIIGQEIGDDLADEIFSRFCMGK